MRHFPTLTTAPCMKSSITKSRFLKQQELIFAGSVFLIPNPAHSLGSPKACGASSNTLKRVQHELLLFPPQTEHEGMNEEVAP